MLNFPISNLPERAEKPRQKGLTMIMDKGLSVREAENLVAAGHEYIDMIKLGFGSALITLDLQKKLDVYKDAKIPVYFGGTLAEAYIIRKSFDQYIKLVLKYKMEYAEVSDGSITIPHDEKCEYIRKLARHVTVISEVGSKEEGIIIHPGVWTKMMLKELEAGVWKVIAEARESGTVGIYRPNGKAHVMLINRITNKVPADKIIWEAPQKSQQAYFIKHMGADVNLGNIAPNEIIALESLRLGLRSDTFFQYLETTSNV